MGTTTRAFGDEAEGGPPAGGARTGSASGPEAGPRGAGGPHGPHGPGDPRGPGGPGGPGHARAEAERLSAELRNACEARLRLEWRHANWQFLRDRLHPPQIVLDQTLARWGAWHAATRTISIAERLVLGYRWESVVETLKHEIAHQVVDELFGATGVVPHGEAFRRACALLGVDPAATGSGGVPLAEPVPGGEHADDARLRRIRGLLALADSTNQHEAEAALAKANELLLKYNLDLAAANAERRYQVRRVSGLYRRRQRHLKLLAGLLGDHFFVEVIWVQSYDVRAGATGVVLELCGTAENVDLAEYAWHELQRAGDDLWRRHQRATGTAGRARGDFLDGVITGFGARLDRERKTLAETRDLVWLGDPGLKAFFRKRHPRVGYESVATYGTDAFAAGREAGEALQLTRALKEHGGDRGRLLSHSG